MCGWERGRRLGPPPLTDAQLDALSAWWHGGSIRAAAVLLRRSERTIINHLYAARIRNNLHTTDALARRYIGSLRTKQQLLTSHNSGRRDAA